VEVEFVKNLMFYIHATQKYPSEIRLFRSMHQKKVSILFFSHFRLKVSEELVDNGRQAHLKNVFWVAPTWPPVFCPKNYHESEEYPIQKLPDTG
jgi:hypothetical protein